MIFCGHEVAAGQKKTILLAEGLEADVYCGARVGKTLVIAAGVHGCEYVGIEALRRMRQMLDPERLSGNVILLPLINAAGFFEGRKQLVPEDGKNLNREFPGKKDGTRSERLAYTIEQCIYPYADFLLDLHGGDCNEALIPLVFYPAAGQHEINEAALEGAKVLSVPYRVRSVARNGLYSYAVQKGIPSLLVERGGAGLWSEEEIQSCLGDLFRILDYLEIQKTVAEPVRQTEITEAVYEEAEEDGFWYPSVSEGERVQSGEIIGILKTWPEERNIELRARFSGVILYYTTALGVQKGTPLAAYGKIED